MNKKAHAMMQKNRITVTCDYYISFIIKGTAKDFICVTFKYLSDEKKMHQGKCIFQTCLTKSKLSDRSIDYHQYSDGSVIRASRLALSCSYLYNVLYKF